MSLNTKHCLRYLLILIALLCTGCDQQRVAPKQPTPTSADPIAQALQRSRTTASPAAEIAMLDAIDLLMEQQRNVEAGHWLGTLEIPQLPPALRIRAVATSARLALLQQDTATALAILTTDRLGLISAQPNMTLQDASQFSLLRAQTYEQAGNPLLAAQERMFLAPLLAAEAYRDNHEKIWLNLTQLPVELLDELRTTAALNEAKGWIELAWIYKAFQDNLDQQISQIQTWQQTFSDHPAALQLPNSLAKLLQLVNDRPERVAILLPQTGRLQSAGRAIVQGVLAAHYAAAENQQGNSEALVLRFYDSANRDSFPQTLQQAIDDGAQLIIGPLQKENVATVQALAGSLTVPVIALNYADEPAFVPAAVTPPAQPDFQADILNALTDPSIAFGSATPPAPISTLMPLASKAAIFQFGLSAEQEAELAATRAFQHNFRHAAVFFPSGEWGVRVQQAFVERWSMLGGSTLTSTAYDTNTGFAQSIKQMLLIPESEARVAELRQLMGPNFEHEPRRRHDIDFVFLIANPAQARQIKPLFNFHYAANLPILATSHVFSGEVNPTLDRDLNRIEFCDIPWLFGEPSPAKRQLGNAWPDNDPRFGRLNALGADAYRLISRIQLLVAVPGANFFGATGTLTLDEDNRIQRELPWYRMHQGHPEAAPELALQLVEPAEEAIANDVEYIYTEDPRTENKTTGTRQPR